MCSQILVAGCGNLAGAGLPSFQISDFAGASFVGEVLVTVGAGPVCADTGAFAGCGNFLGHALIGMLAAAYLPATYSGSGDGLGLLLHAPVRSFDTSALDLCTVGIVVEGNAGNLCGAGADSRIGLTGFHGLQYAVCVEVLGHEGIDGSTAKLNFVRRMLALTSQTQLSGERSCANAFFHDHDTGTVGLHDAAKGTVHIHRTIHNQVCHGAGGCAIRCLKIRQSAVFGIGSLNSCASIGRLKIAGAGFRGACPVVGFSTPVCVVEGSSEYRQRGIHIQRGILSDCQSCAGE